MPSRVPELRLCGRHHQNCERPQPVRSGPLRPSFRGLWTTGLRIRHMPRRTAESDAYGIRRRALAVLAASLTRREHEIIKSLTGI
jgi:hypothetical protein